MKFSWKKSVVASVLVVGLGLTTACGDDNPNSPSNPNAPRILSVSPSRATVSNNAQTITVSGDRFASGLSILLDAPDGVWTTYSGSAISVQSPTSFTATVMLNKVGSWDMTVTNPDGLESNEVRFSVAQ
jgi:hypothetical protein